MKPFLIAEIGINHNGDIEIAKKLIDYAQEAKFDAVKFQKRDINSVYTKEFLDGYRESPWGKTQRDQKLGLEFNEKEYQLIDDYCSKKKIQWFASAWDINSQKFLRKFDLKYNKVASAMLGNFPLLREIASEKKYTFISTGVSTLEEIDKVVKLFKDHKCPFELMHCNSSYPMRDSEANLSCIKLLKEKFNCDVGYSGHENSLIGVSIIAVALGATSVERHITLDRTLYGSDQAASIEPDGLIRLVRDIRIIDGAMGTGEKILNDFEQVHREKLATPYWVTK